MAIDLGSRFVVGKAGRIQGRGGRTIIVIPMLVAVCPGTKRANESAIGGNNVGVNQLGPEKVKIGAWGAALGGESPARTAVRRTPSSKGLGVDVSAFAVGKVTETESLEKEAATLETANVF